MNTIKISSIAFTILIFTSCNFSFSLEKNMTTKSKTINGVDYVFSNDYKCKNAEMFFAKEFQLENKISFFGMGKVIKKVISKSDFEKKVDFSNIEAFDIDSVSFSVNDKKDKIELIYYLNLGNKLKSVAMRLEKDNEMWNLN